MRIRSIPNLSSLLLGDVTADDVTLTSLSSSAESGRDVIASLRPSRDVSRSRQHAAPTEFSPTGFTSGSESARVDDVTEKWRRRRKSESPKDARMQAATANVDRDKRRRGHQTSRPTTSPSFFSRAFSALFKATLCRPVSDSPVDIVRVNFSLPDRKANRRVTAFL